MNITEVTLPDTLSLSDLKVLLTAAISRTEFPPEGLNVHKKYAVVEVVENGKTIKKKGDAIEGEIDGYRYNSQSVIATMAAPMALTINGGKLFSQNVRVSIDAFKLEDSPSAFATRKASDTGTAAPALTFDQVKAGLAARRNTTPATPKA